VGARRGAADFRCAALALVPALALWAADPGPDGRPPTGTIDLAHSQVEVAVGRSGLLSAFGHDHRILAPVSSGRVRSQGGPAVEIAFDARSLRVADAGLSDPDREKVQATMKGPDVLDAEKYPEIVFRSSAIEAAGTGRWSVSGSLTLRGETRPVRAEVSQSGRRYRGHAAFPLTDFGIRPPVVAGGTVRVRDEVRIVFDVAVEEPGA
jgi:polyisoprenoid-binding protein YceI